ncbi:hypothetical protein [Natronorubrum texcoconense]|uniref:Uncharacterized protein n=1 Tax=Natronorubrum texcoconense TaxID=1095776 RepID=A0A1G9H804_9EURY|nr:hypothetical protein [Natronorubrum texcoconense]SDL09091.1 hypothetical protein SAMN04515672_0141 [Natronorubrum texcoconense]
MSTHTPPTDGQQATEQQRTELSELRRKLSNKYEYIRDDDPELFEEIDTFLRTSSTLHDGSIGSAVKSELRELKRDKKMRDHRGVEDPEAAFPDDCEGCPHYGVVCPMVKRYSVTKTIERILRRAESDEQVLEKLTDVAIEQDCHVILDVLEECQGSYTEFLQEGYELNARAVKALTGPGETTDSDGVTTSFDDGPSPEDKQRMEDTIEAVMADDEDGDSS